MKILVMGLPGSGKTYLAERMQPILKAAWYNADIVREMANDWDFSPEGRIRQSLRMKNLADFEKNQGRIVICDFVCPTHETKENFNPDITVWMNTITSGRYEDTNKMSENLKMNIKDVGIDYDARAMEKPSDHCPVWLELNE